MPSRLGLLLDLSPRNLERVLYFAQYVFISVDEDARQRHLSELQQQLDELTQPADETEEAHSIDAESGKDLGQESATKTVPTEDESKATNFPVLR